MRPSTRRVGLLAAVIAVLLTLTGLPAMAAEPGSITVTVTNSAGAPVNTCVSVYAADTGDWLGSECAVDAGVVTIGGLTDGQAYKVEAVGDGQTGLDTWYDGAESMDSATPVVAPADVAIMLRPAGLVQGTLLDIAGQPVAGGSVTFYDLSYSYRSAAWTDEGGRWSAFVPPGDYKIQFMQGVSEMWYPRAFSFDAAQTVTVEAGATLTADAQFVERGAVVGTVTDARTGAPIAGVQVKVLDPVNADPSGGDGVGWATTDDQGAYRADITNPGTYTVQFTAGDQGYVGVYAGGTRDIAAARTVTVSEFGQVRLDQTMTLGATLTGRAVDQRGRMPLAGVNVSLATGTYDPNAWWKSNVWGVGGTSSDANGWYTVTGVPTGTYTMMLTPPWQSGYARQWYQKGSTQATATPIAVTTASKQTLKTVAFVPGATVTGVIREQQGQPVPNGCVDMMGNYAGRAGAPEGLWSVCADENGRYAIGVAAGTYTPLAFAPYSDTLAPSWYGGATTKATATPVNLKAGKSITLDFVLPVGGHIVGKTVTAAGEKPIGFYVMGEVYNTSGDHIGMVDAGDYNDWTLHSTPLPPGRYVIQAKVYDMATGNATDAWYDGASSRATATTITVGPLETREIVFHLP